MLAHTSPPWFGHPKFRFFLMASLRYNIGINRQHLSRYTLLFLRIFKVLLFTLSEARKGENKLSKSLKVLMRNEIPDLFILLGFVLNVFVGAQFNICLSISKKDLSCTSKEIKNVKFLTGFSQ